MKIKHIREKSTKELEEMLKELKLNQIIVSSNWGNKKVKNKESGMKTSSSEKNTKLRRDIRRNIARINTIIREKELKGGDLT